jgi:hypothetical protein
MFGVFLEFLKLFRFHGFLRVRELKRIDKGTETVFEWGPRQRGSIPTGCENVTERTQLF